MGFAGFDDAGLALGASEGLARVDALADTVDIFSADGISWTFVVSAAFITGRFRSATDGQVVGVALESVATNTRCPMSVGDADGVGSALFARAGVDAATDASVLDTLIDWKTNFTGGAIEIVATRRNGTDTAGSGRVTRKTKALSVAASGIRSASDARTRIVDIGLDRWLDANRHTHHERIAREAFLTATVVTSGRVQTYGIGSAGVSDTFVDI